MKPVVRVAVTGAAGQIGYSLLFRIAAGEMLGHDQPVVLQLLEITPALKTLGGVAMELEDCAFPLLHSLVLTDNPDEAFKDADYALLVGSRPRGPGNNRALGQLAAKTGQPVGTIKRMTIWGNHSSTQVPDLSQATVAGRPAVELIDEAWVREGFIPTVQQRGAAVIAARGLSSAASAASAAIDHMRDWVKGTSPGDWISMAIPSTGDYGVAEGIIYSFPVTVKDGEVSVVKGLELPGYIREKMKLTEQELLEERAAIAPLLDG